MFGGLDISILLFLPLGVAFLKSFCGLFEE